MIEDIHIHERQMKRRSFVAFFFLGLLGLSGYLFTRWFHTPDGEEEVIAQPKFLSTVCDEKTIRKLGNAYLKLKPGEANYLLANDFSTPTSLTEKKEKLLFLESQIEKKIANDFEKENVVVVQGWVLSVTEARQCAFFATHK